MVVLKDTYLNALTIKPLKDKTFKILAEGSYQKMPQADGTDREKFVMPIKLSDNTDILYIPNATAQKTLRKRFGNDTAKWVGKTAEFELIKQNVRGEIKDVVFIKERE